MQSCHIEWLQQFLRYESILIKVLCFMGAAINYGGRVTDDKDKRLIQTIIKRYVATELVGRADVMTRVLRRI